MSAHAAAPFASRPAHLRLVAANPHARPEAVLSIADAYGTLAAARSLGRAGIGVVLAADQRLAPTRWSRYVTRTVACPDVGAAPERFLDRLLELGAEEPGRVLCATSDDVVWMLARHRDALGRSFRLYVPPIEAVHTLLDKWRLHAACVALRIDCPDTWLAPTEEDLRRLSREARFPLLIKPRTQAFLSPHQKGRIARDEESLVRQYRDLESCTRHAAMLVEYDEDAALAIVQSYREAGADKVYSLAGFIDETGELFVVEASRKVLQWPQHLGVGLCFEEATVVPKLADDVKRLCRRVGYYGPFEVEFVESGERHELIDFNPRFYGQMGFDISRGLDLPLFTYLAAAGDQVGLRRAVDAARRAPAHREVRAYCNRIELEIVLRLLRLARGIDGEEGARWHRWVSAHRRLTDSVLDRDDWLPGVVDVAAALLRRAAHPRSSWRAARSSRA